MTPSDMSKCRELGANDACFEKEQRTLTFSATRMAWVVLESKAEAAEVPIEFMLQRLLDAAGAHEFVVGETVLKALAEQKAAPQNASTFNDKRLYFMQRGVDGAIKIGVSDNVLGRAKQLSTGSDEEIRILLSVAQTDELNERALHRRFAAHRKSGEWFEPVAEILALIDSIPGNRQRVAGGEY